MKLIYRGISHDYTPPTVEMAATEAVGHFRGLDIRFRSMKKAPVQQPTLDLVYRGVAYRTGTTEAKSISQPISIPAIEVESTLGTENKARMMMLNRHRHVKQRQQSMLTRLATEAGLSLDTAGYWNHIQGKVHPSFWATYSRSGAAVS